MADEVNVAGTRALIEDMRTRRVDRLIFASTCSNYGRMANHDVLATEESPLAPVSVYAEQEVAIESDLLAHSWEGIRATCLRFATVYGVAPRMRSDLTVNEFTRDLWTGLELDVYGQQFWRPYVHVDDAAAAIELMLTDDGEGWCREQRLQRRIDHRELSEVGHRRRHPAPSARRTRSVRSAGGRSSRLSR